MEKIVPYPRPNYTDPELDSKEMINGSFIQALFDDIKNFRPAFDRYNVTENKLIAMSATKTGHISPENFDITMRDLGWAGMKEISWLPYYRKENSPDPEVIYYPLDYYDDVEYIPYRVEEVRTNYIENVLLDIPYYDMENPGLFGFQTIKDKDGNVTERRAYFYSLITHQIHYISTISGSLEIDSMTYLGYVKGGMLFHIEPTTIICFNINGGHTVKTGLESRVVNFGDHGTFAVSDGSSSFVYDINFNLQPVAYFDKTGTLVTGTSLPGDFCSAQIDINVSGYAKFPFGTVIGGKFYFPRTNTESNKWGYTKNGWMAKKIKKPIWIYNKMIKYDYITDNWMNVPLKAMHYNQIVNGVYVPNILPCKDKSCEFKSSDPYGDFTAVGDELYHTFDFKKWESVGGDAHSSFYGMWERIWVKDGDDGIVGYMPYTFSIVDAEDLDTGEKKMYSRFEGFVFKRTG